MPGIPRSDFEWYFYPQRVFLSRWLSRGIFPFWNPHLFCGYPTVEIQQSALFYPFNTFSLMVFEPGAGLLVMLAAHIVLGVAFTWLAFEKCFALPRIASVMGGLLFVYGSVFAHRLFAGHMTIVFALPWLPLGFGAIAAALRGGRETGRLLKAHQGRWLVLAGVCSACVVLAGAPQYIFYMFWGQAAVAFAAKASWKRKALSFILIWMAAMAISAPQWLPSLYYIGHGARTSGLYQTYMPHLTRLVTIIEFLIPYPLGDGVTQLHIHRRGVWDTAGYCGTGALILALVSLACRGAWRGGSVDPLSNVTRQGLAMFLIAFYHGLGGWLPGFGFFREPIRAMVLVNIATALLASVGLARVFSMTVAQSFPCMVLKGRPRFSKRAMLISTVIGLIAGGAALYSRHAPRAVADMVITLSETNFVMGHPEAIKYVQAIMGNPELGAGPVFKAFTFSCAATACLLLFLVVSRRWPLMAMFGVVLLVVGDPLFMHWRLFTPMTDRATSGWPDDFRDEIARKIKPGCDGTELPWRVAIPTPMTNGAMLVEGLNEPYGYDPLSPQMAYARTFTMTTSTIDYGSIRSLKQASLAMRAKIEETRTGLPETLPENVRDYIYREVTTAGAVLAYFSPYVELYEGDGYFGPLDGARDFIRPPDDKRAPHALAPPPRRTVDERNGMMTSPMDFRPFLRHEPSATPNRLHFIAETIYPVWLIVRSTWLPGWQLHIDGKHAGRPIETNGWMMGIPLDAGRHDIRLDYRPVGLTVARVISILGMLLCIVALITRDKRNRE
ncbi:MAG: hypothetical protein WCK47_00980 [bacterium]|nr:hypothetical protein [Candidatus Sumerlaeota bacterium]